MKNANLVKVYKDHSFLIFDLDDGSSVKYDFATKKAFGKSGKWVMDLKSQLRNITIEDIYQCCEDPQYAKFLRFVRNCYSASQTKISNIGTILSHVPSYAIHEQIFSAGVDNVDSHLGDYKFKDIPSGLIKLCRMHNLKLSKSLIKHYKIMPDVFNLAFQLEYTSLDNADIISALNATEQIIVRSPGYLYHYYYEEKNIVNQMIAQYGYQAKPLLMYLDRLKTFEALSDFRKIVKELSDYAGMMVQVGAKFERYPRNFLTTHAIASRNYNRLKIQFEESAFAARIKPDMEVNFGEFAFIYPRCTQDIKDEAIQMNHCVASYIQRVIDGQCDIIFLRRKDRPDKSLVTCQVVGNKITQALQAYNQPLTPAQEIAVDKWNRWYSAKKQEEENVSNHEKHTA